MAKPDFAPRHSTATDALRGGLPLLTARGAEFPQRVGLSLQRAVGAGQTLLQAEDARDFEDLAVFLTSTAAGRAAARALRRRLAEEGRAAPLFDTAAFTANIERAYHLVWDAHVADGGLRRHVVVAPRAPRRASARPAPAPYHAVPVAPIDDAALPARPGHRPRPRV